MSVTILSCAYRGLSVGTHMSIVNAITTLGWQHRIITDDALLDHARGVLVSAWYRETDDRSFVMLDNDMVVSPDQLKQLVRHLWTSDDYDIVSATYPARLGQTLTGSPLDPNSVWPADGSLIELDRGGLGCVAVKRSAIAKMVEVEEELDVGYITGSFWPLFMPYTHNGNYIPEDTSFYWRARSVGCRAWLDPEVCVKHLSNELPVTKGNMILVNAAYNSSHMGGLVSVG